MSSVASRSLAAITVATAVAALVCPGSANAGPGGAHNQDHRSGGSGYGVPRGGYNNGSRAPGRVGRPPVRRPGNGNGGAVRVPRPRGRGAIVRDGRTGQVYSRNGRPIIRAQPGRGYGRDRRIVIGPARTRDEVDQFVVDAIIRRASNMSCDNLADLVRELSNDILSSQTLPPEVIYPGDSPDERRRKFYANELRRFMANPRFSRTIMERLTYVFEGCDQLCFSDGVAIGVISGTGYCSASLEVGGLPDEDGFRFQEALPVCETANFAGCAQGYSQAVNSVNGCLGFATGEFAETYNNFVSQDCHIESEN